MTHFIPTIFLVGLLTSFSNLNFKMNEMKQYLDNIEKVLVKESHNKRQTEIISHVAKEEVTVSLEN